MLFSVLVPVYNVQDYLKECIESILNQTEQDFELVLLDDCSTDNSGHICNEYASRYPGIIRAVHNETNEGLLLTRRKLFSLAQGEWVVCVDSDDIIVKTALSVIRRAFEAYHVDMVMFNLLCFYVDGHSTVFKPALKREYVYSASLISKIYESLTKNKYSNSLCTKAFRRRIIDLNADYTEWKELSIGEDLFQSYPLWDSSKSIVYIDEALYHYRKNEISMTSQQPVSFYHMRKILWNRDDKYQEKWHVSKTTSEIVLHQRITEILNYIRIMLTHHESSIYVPYLYEIKDDGLLLEYLSRTQHRLRLYDWIVAKLFVTNQFKLLRMYCVVEKNILTALGR